MRTLIVLFFIGAVILNTPEVASASEAISTEESTADYLAIQRVFLQEDFSETNRLSEAFLSRYPDAPGATRVALWRILSLDRIGEKQQALAKIRLLMERLPQTDALWSEAVFWDGEISRRSQETARAARAYRRLLEKSANSQWTSQARMGLGLVCIQEQEFEKAQEHFRKVSTDRKATPLGQEAQVLEGLCLLRLRKFQEAASFLEPLMGSLQQANLRAQAFCYLGESFSGLKDFAQALTHYRAALESTDSPWEAVAQFGVGWSAAELNRCQESVEAFDRYFSLRLKERRAEALFIQGRCLLQLGKEREGIWRLKQMSSEFPGHPLALESGLIVSERYRLERRWDLAKQSLHALLRQHPEGRRRAKVLVSLGRLALDQTNVAEARTVLQLAAKTDELAVKQEALSGLAEIQVFLGNFQAAEDLYEEAMWLDEESAAAVAAAYRVARLRLDMNDANGAIAILQRLESTAQGRLKEDAQIGLVAAYLAQRKDMLAKEIIRKIYAEKPSQMMSGRVAYYEALLTLGEGNELLASQFCRDATLWAIHTEEGFEAKLLLIEMEAQDEGPIRLFEELEKVERTEALSWGQRALLAKRKADAARRANQCAQAIKAYGDASELWPAQRGECAYRIASCYEEAEDIELALSWYGRIDQTPWDTRGQLAMAKLLERQNRVAESVEIYERLAHETIPEAEFIRERLAEYLKANP